MIVALYISLALVLVGAVLKLTDRRDAQPPAEPAAAVAEECCGLHEVCEKSADAALSDEIEYFDDEELDLMAGRPAAGYSDAEIDQFREVMLTLPRGEAMLWMRSLERRGIALPDELRDEFILFAQG